MGWLITGILQYWKEKRNLTIKLTLFIGCQARDWKLLGDDVS